MNTYKVVFIDSAKKRLLEITDYIALDNPIRARSFVKELTTSLRKTLSIFPYSGRIAEDFSETDEIRVTSFGNYNSYYRVVEYKQIVEVLFIFNASRDIKSFKRT